MMMQSFDTILQNLMDPNDRRQRGPRGMGDDPFLSSTDPDWLNDDHLTGHHPGLFPRNTDGPQPRNQPMPLPQ
jgi:E3 ubiquitin-protein ligase RNF115/126